MTIILIYSRNRARKLGMRHQDCQHAGTKPLLPTRRRLKHHHSRGNVPAMGERYVEDDACRQLPGRAPGQLDRGPAISEPNHTDLPPPYTGSIWQDLERLVDRFLG